MAVAVGLLVEGCSTSSHKSAVYSHEAQGAPGVEQNTEVTTASGGIETTNEAELQLHKEEMVVAKREVSNGGVLVRTVVQTENVSQPVELQREDYVVERIPASQAAAGAAQNAFVGREIYIPLTREEPLASKRTFVSETVQLGKRIETDRQTVSTPVRSEDVQITKVAGPAPGNVWQESAPVLPASALDKNALSLRREEMVVGKTVVDNGGVRLQKVVSTQVVSQPVELKREEYTVDRSPVSTSEPTEADFSQKEIRLSLSREEPVVGTRIEPTEWVRVRKQIHTDTQTVSGTIRKENIEVVELASDQTAMGGTSAAGQSGAAVISGSSTPRAVKASVIPDSPTPPFITLKGKALCAKCQLHQAALCQTVIQVKDGENSQNYYLVQNDVSRKFHEDVCKQARPVTVTGSVSEMNGQLFFIPSKIALVH